MRPKERRDSGQNDLFRSRLDEVVDLGHPLAKLGRAIDWRFLEGHFGRPIPMPLAIRRLLIREQAYGEALDPDKLDRLGRDEVHLDRSLSMQIKLTDLWRPTVPG